MMKKTVLLSLSLLTFLCQSGISQTAKEKDSTWITEKAKYLKEDLTKALSLRIEYPPDAVMNNIQGYVVVSLIIGKNGKQTGLSVRSSPHELLSTSATAAVYSLQDGWSPAKVNGAAIDKSYTIVFRFRIVDYEPADYRSQADKLKEKQKYDKAVKACDKGIKDNPYDYKLYELRSTVKKLMDDSDGSKSDMLAAENLKEEVLEVIYVTARAVVRRAVMVDQRVVQY